MLSRFFLLSFSLLIYTGATFAQIEDNVPPNAEPGKCYGRSYVPNQYGFKDTVVVDRPAYKKIETRQVLVTPETTREINVPATYKTMMVSYLKKKGGFTEWTEIVCEEDVTARLIDAIQMSLNDAGFDAGSVDNQLGPKTKDALRVYQEVNSLPVGNLNVEPLKSLGINPENYKGECPGAL